MVAILLLKAAKSFLEIAVIVSLLSQDSEFDKSGEIIIATGKSEIKSGNINVRVGEGILRGGGIFYRLEMLKLAET